MFVFVAIFVRNLKERTEDWQDVFTDDFARRVEYNETPMGISRLQFPLPRKYVKL